MEKPATASVTANRIVCDDNLKFMAGLPDACCDLIYAINRDSHLFTTMGT